ncbi:MAG: hypothetical protein JST76_07895 [Bacteroidetes bacterium]|nr:hypothetical protein [Bacteroidota bacterium]
MTSAIIIIVVIIVAIAAFLLYRRVAVTRQGAERAASRLAGMAPLAEKLKRGTLALSDVQPYASDIITRSHVLELLHEHQRLDLFPAEYHTKEKMAESVLANWLEFPTELDSRPDEMELLKIVPIQIDEDPEHKLLYYAFRFCTHEPHWAAKNGWTIGIAGPYFADGPEVTPATAFSRFNKEGQVIIEEEVAWFHENVAAQLMNS